MIIQACSLIIKTGNKQNGFNIVTFSISTSSGRKDWGFGSVCHENQTDTERPWK